MALCAFTTVLFLMAGVAGAAAEAAFFATFATFLVLHSCDCQVQDCVLQDCVLRSCDCEFQDCVLQSDERWRTEDILGNANGRRTKQINV